jgi:hypothetical protein
MSITSVRCLRADQARSFDTSQIRSVREPVPFEHLRKQSVSAALAMLTVLLARDEVHQRPCLGGDLLEKVVQTENADEPVRFAPDGDASTTTTSPTCRSRMRRAAARAVLSALQ